MPMPTEPIPAAPVTHRHIFNVVKTLIRENDIPSDKPLRILDIGCGDGRMILSLHRLAQQELPDRRVEVHGFDIGEHGFADGGQHNEAVSFLENQAPDVDWTSRIKIFSDTDDWAYEADSFNLAVSNQVLEHVEDMEGFLGNLNRVLVSDGVSVHLFPLSHCMQEAHCHVPLSHWIRNYESRKSWIALMSRLGIGRYRYDRRVLGHSSVREHAEETANFIERWTCYRSFSEIARLASKEGMATSYHFTKDFFFTKARMVARRPAGRTYRRWTFMGLEWLSYMFGRALSSSTLVIRPVDYDIGKRVALEKADRLPAKTPVTEQA